jgi:NAD(P)-dependent dehydrogenase (short-subunit alcohol dehydrogenase family)
VQVDLKDKVALVTGAAQGIGRAIADTLAANGARVVYSDRNLDGLAGSPHHTLALDVGDRDQITHGVKHVLDRYGRLDILVNNAGIGVKAQDRLTVDEFPVETWDEMLRIDLTGVFLVSQAGARAMKAAKSGRIINIASVMGLVPIRLQSSYVAAKAGVVNLTRSMALELAPHGILVNAVAPGSTATEGWKKWIHDPSSAAHDAHARLMSHIPLGRPATTQEIANAVLFLAAPESSYITGHVLSVDGGWTAGFTRDF